MRLSSLGMLVVMLVALPVDAGIFKRNPKPDPVKRVPELIAVLKTDREEKNRIAAAEELRNYDVKRFNEIVPALLLASEQDSSSSVRIEAIYSLGKIRPISQQVGDTLTKIMHNDQVIRVRVAARSTLWQYHILGYRSSKIGPDALLNQSKEPPLAEPINSSSEKLNNSYSPLPKQISSRQSLSPSSGQQRNSQPIPNGSKSKYPGVLTGNKRSDDSIPSSTFPLKTTPKQVNPSNIPFPMTTTPIIRRFIRSWNHNLRIREILS